MAVPCEFFSAKKIALCRATVVASGRSAMADFAIPAPSSRVMMPMAREAIPAAELALQAKHVNRSSLLPKGSFRTHDARIRRRKHNSGQVERGIATYWA